MSEFSSFEEEFEEYLEQTGMKFKSHKGSLVKSDFLFFNSGKRNWVEVKHKKRPYKLSNWPVFQDSGVPEERSLIVDECSVRRLIAEDGEQKFIVIKDTSGIFDRYYVFDEFMLIIARPIICERPISKTTNKAKLFYDLSDAYKCKTLDGVFRFFRWRTQRHKEIACKSSENNILSSYARILKKDVPVGGVERTLEYKQLDLDEK